MAIILKEKEGENIPQEISFDTLKIKLREDLHDQFSDNLVMKIVNEFLDNETIRLKASEYKIQAISPKNDEYIETIRDLNSYFALLNRWAKSTPLDYNEKLNTLKREFESALDSIITVPSPFYLVHGGHVDKNGKPIKITVKYNRLHLQQLYNQPPYYIELISNSDGSIKSFSGPLPSKYCFYYTALLVLLKEFRENQQVGTVNGELTIPQHVAVYCLLNQNIDLSKGEEQKLQSEYISTSGINLDEKGRLSFARSIRRHRNEDNWTHKKISNRLKLLRSIEAFIESKNRNLLISLEKEKKYFTDKLAEPE